MMHFGIQNSWKEHYNNVRWVTSPKPSHPLARWAPLNSWWAQYSHSEIIYMRCNQQNKTCMARLSLAIRLLASVGAPWNVSSSISSFSSTSINPAGVGLTSIATSIRRNSVELFLLALISDALLLLIFPTFSFPPFSPFPYFSSINSTLHPSSAWSVALWKNIKTAKSLKGY